MLMKKYEPDKDFKIMTCDEVRSFDAYAINTVGIHGTVLMENGAPARYSNMFMENTRLSASP